jgi:putative ABC transport system permease protein
MVFALGFAACLIAIPPGVLAADTLASVVAEMMNFDPPEVQLTWGGVLLQLAVGLLVPLMATTPVIMKGTRISPARVLSEYSISQVWSGAGIFDRIIRRFSHISRETLLALRNPFRKRGRLILSLIAMTFAGAVFMAIQNLQVSLNSTLNNEIFDFWRYDASVILHDYYPPDRLINEVKKIDGVDRVETWGFGFGRYVRPNGTESDEFYIDAPIAGSPLLDPPIIAGRSIEPGDTNSVVVTPGFLAREPGLQLGSQMKIKIKGRKEYYTIVGIMSMMSNSSVGYFTVMDLASFSRHVRAPNRSNSVIITMIPRETEAQRLLLSKIENHFDKQNVEVLTTFLIAEEREEINASFSVIIALLMVMTVLLSTVGGLGMMGTMSLNVLERTREIGVMRAYGASSRSIFRTVIIEGLLIGGISWILAVGFSLPLSVLLSRSIGKALLENPFAVSISSGGILGWAGLVIIISIVASLLPAMRAVRLTVTEVLGYE